MKGKLIFLLHAHLPYVLSHGRWPHGVDWLNEACAETYIPLLNMLEELSSEGLRPQLTISLSPTLCEMLSREEFKGGFQTYLEERCEASERELRALSKDDPLHGLALRWRDFYGSLKKDFTERYCRDLLSAFRRLQEAGSIELITTCATHGYLPLLSDDGSIRMQIGEAIRTHKRYFGSPPRGIWLPECAYRPAGSWQNPLTGSSTERRGIGEFLQEAGIGYIVVDTHMITGHTPVSYGALWGRTEMEYTLSWLAPQRSPYRVFRLAGTEVCLLARDPSTGVQVWSAQWGYPGDGAYLEFHKRSFPAGLKFWRVTNRDYQLDRKALYEPQVAAQRAAEHALDFIELVERVASGYTEHTGSPAVIVAPYDAELFGHWWHEGLCWLRRVIEGLKKGEGRRVELVTAGSLMDREGLCAAEEVELPEGSWGDGGGHRVWLNEKTKWIWRSIYAAESVMRRVCQLSKPKRDELTVRILKQMARELLLLQSSDWPFLITTNAAKDYAEERVHKHFEDFKRLALVLEGYIKEGTIGKEAEEFLTMVEQRDPLFADIDFSSFEGEGDGREGY